MCQTKNASEALRTKNSNDDVSSKNRIATHPTYRELRDTLRAAVIQAFLPLHVLKSSEYSRYLSEQVAGYTLGWQVFRVAAETNYLLYHGRKAETLVVQIFLACSASAVLLCLLRRKLWLQWREQVCICMNCVYSIVTFLKVFHFVPRLPDESHYLFKHCLLSMADAFFCQVPVHKFYIAQVIDALLRCMVWRRYEVLPGAPMLVVIFVSLAWQAWIISFSCMLQARHVTSYVQLQQQQQQPQSQLTEVPPSGAPSHGSATTGIEAVRRAAQTTAAGTPRISAVVADVTRPPPLSGSGEAWRQQQQQQPQQESPSLLLSSPLQQQQRHPPVDRWDLHPLNQQPFLLSRPPFQSVHTRPVGPGSGSSTLTATMTAASDASPEAFLPSALHTTDLLLSRGSSTSTRSRSALSSIARQAFRVITPAGGGTGGCGASGEEDLPLWSSDEPLHPVAEAGSGWDRHGVADRRCAFDEMQEEEEGVRWRRSSGGSAHGAEDYSAVIPMLSMVNAMEDSSELRGQDTEEEVANSRLRCAPPMSGLSLDTVRDLKSVVLPASAPTAVNSKTAASETLRSPMRRTSAPLVPPTQPSCAPLVAELLTPRAGGYGSSRGSQRSNKADKALQRLISGPSSYVLLSKQNERRAHIRANVQVVVSLADPSKLTGTTWRDRLMVAVAESAPGWHLVNASVRKGSLIVHLDLVYQPVNATETSGVQVTVDAGVEVQAVNAAAAECVLPLPSPPSPQPPPPPLLPEPCETLRQGFLSLGSAGILDALSLSEHVPRSPDDFVSVQYGDQMLQFSTAAEQLSAPVWTRLGPCKILPTQLTEYSPPSWAVSVSAGWESGSEASARLHQRRGPRGGVQLATTTVMSGLRPCREAAAAAAATAEASISCLHAAALRHATALYDNLLLALHPPSLVSSREYIAFLHGRVSILHNAYTNLMAATTLMFFISNRATGLRLGNVLCFMAPELLAVTGRAVGGRRGGGEIAVAARVPLVHVGVVLRGLQMLATSLGFMECMSQGDEMQKIEVRCMEMRWIMKTLIVSALQALCMQTPVRLTFLLRLVPLAGAIMSHLRLCHPGGSVLAALALHLAWEAGLFVMAAFMQARHVKAYRLHRQLMEGPTAAAAATLSRSPSVPLSRVTSCFSFAEVGGSSVGDKTADDDSGSVYKCLSLSPQHPSAAAGFSSELGIESTVESFLSGPYREKSPPTSSLCTNGGCGVGGGGGGDTMNLELLWSPVEQWDGVRGMAGGGREGVSNSDADPWDISLDRRVLVISPRRASVLHVCFTCTARVVDELQMVLRHLTPASAADGLHRATSAAVITRPLAPPAAAYVQQPHGSVLRFNAQLTMVAAPQDTPGVLHVELWRGHRRLAGRPVLLAPAATVGSESGVSRDLSEGGSFSVVAAQRLLSPSSIPVATAAPGEVEVEIAGWVQDVEAYVGIITAEGHAAAAAQFLEDLGGWLAQVVALQRGLTTGNMAFGAHNPAASSAGHRIARVLRVHSAGWMPPPPSPAPAAAKQAATASGSALPMVSPMASPPPSKPSPSWLVDHTSAALHRMLICEGQGLLAVVVEAGCVALSEHMLAQLLGPLEAELAAVVEAAVTPVTGLPLMHAAVKSGCPEIVDLVVSWLLRAGATDIWSREAVVRAVSLELRCQMSSTLSGGAFAVTHLAGPCGVHPVVDLASPGGMVAPATALPPIATVATAAALAPPSSIKSQELVVTRFIDSETDCMIVLAQGGEEPTKALAMTAGLDGLVDCHLLHSIGDRDDNNLTGSFHLQANGYSPPPSLNALPPPPPLTSPLPSSLTVAGPPSGDSQLPTAHRRVAGMRESEPLPRSPLPSSIAIPVESGGCSFTATAATAESFISTGTSMAPAISAAELALPFAATSLTLPYKVVCLHSETNDASSAIQVLPRDARDAEEPPQVLCDPRFGRPLLPGGASEPSATFPHNPRSASVYASPTLAVGTKEDRSHGVATTNPSGSGGSGGSNGGGRGNGCKDGGGVVTPQRNSFDSQWELVDGGMLLLTPLHVAVALGDEGRVVAHIFSKYQEAHELWSAGVGQSTSSGINYVSSGLELSSMVSPFNASHMPTSPGLGPGPGCSSSVGLSGQLVPSGISLRRCSSIANAASALRPGQSHASHARHRLSGFSGCGGSVATQGGTGSGVDGGDGGGGGDALLSPLRLGAINDVEPGDEMVRSLSLGKVAF